MLARLFFVLAFALSSSAASAQNYLNRNTDFDKLMSNIVADCPRDDFCGAKDVQEAYQGIWKNCFHWSVVLHGLKEEGKLDVVNENAKYYEYCKSMLTFTETFFTKAYVPNATPQEVEVAKVTPQDPKSKSRTMRRAAAPRATAQQTASTARQGIASRR